MTFTHMYLLPGNWIHFVYFVISLTHNKIQLTYWTIDVRKYTEIQDYTSSYTCWTAIREVQIFTDSEKSS